MLPYKTLIEIQKNSNTPIYLQIANSFIINIRKGIIKPGTKLPGTRVLSKEFSVHRKTVICAFDELTAQGWIISIPKKGAVVSTSLPEVLPSSFKQTNILSTDYPITTGYKLKENKLLGNVIKNNSNLIELIDGFPDVRLAPIEILGRTYRGILQRPGTKKLLNYADVEGNYYLREVLSNYMNQSRGLKTRAENIFITRGSQMSIYLLSHLLLNKGDNIIVGETNYFVANMTFTYLHANLITTTVDEFGICVDEIETICLKIKVKALYITSHHHYPTTVTLSSERRIKLLSLAERYKFAIIEDDYDYDFHYSMSPILPIASADTNGMTAYVGSFNKSIAPAFRVGYIVGPQNLIKELAKLRRIIDRQGDLILEQVFAEMINEGEIKRHIKKTQRIYHERRDYMCDLLTQNLGKEIKFKIPDGGLAIWAQFEKSIDLVSITEKALKKGLSISNGSIHNPINKNLNSTRLGFASLTFQEAEKAVQILSSIIKNK